MWAIIWSILICFGLWLAAQTIWRRGHYPMRQASCVEHGGTVHQVGDGFACSYDFTKGKP